MKLVLAILVAMSMFSAQAVLIGKVDIQKVLVSIKEGQSVRDQLKKVFDEKQKLLKGDEEKIKKLQEEYEKKALVMNADAKGKKEKEIQGKIMEIQQKQAQYQGEIQEMENNLKKPILEKLKVVVDEVSKATNVEMTFEAATAPVIYAKEEKDLTDEVIAAYNKKHSK